MGTREVEALAVACAGGDSDVEAEAQRIATSGGSPEDIIVMDKLRKVCVRPSTQGGVVGK